MKKDSVKDKAEFNKETLFRFLDGWLSKKWLITLMCLAAGIYFKLSLGLTGADVSFLLGISAIYGGANVANKAALLKHTKLGSEEEFPDRQSTSSPSFNVGMDDNTLPIESDSVPWINMEMISEKEVV